MSRSYKKNLVAKERNNKYNKKCANKRVRRYNDIISNGKGYKKIYESYDICDYAFLAINEHEIYDYGKCTDKHERFNRIKDYKNK